jgi:hypothetical protein
MAAVLTRDPAQRDPAWRARVSWLLAGAVLLWPLLVWTEFKPWVLFAPESLKPTLNFLPASCRRASTPNSCSWSRARPGARWPSRRPASRWRWCWRCR